MHRGIRNLPGKLTLADWLDDHLPHCVILGLTPQEFYDLTFKEYSLLMKGWQLKHRLEWEPYALLASLMTVFMKNKKQPSKIMEDTGYTHLKRPVKKYDDIQQEKKILKAMASKYGTN